MRQLVLEIAPQAAPTLEGFIAGDNAELLEVLRELAAGRLNESVVYLWGGEGSGRSHLLAATQGAATRPERLVLADDVESLDPAGQIALFSRINEFRAAGTDGRAGTVLAAGPVPPAQLGLREDLRSRLAWGLVYQVKPLSDADKAAYLREAAARRGMRIPDEVVAWLLSHVRRDLPTLVAILAQLDTYSLSHKRTVTIPLVREALADFE